MNQYRVSGGSHQGKILFTAKTKLYVGMGCFRFVFRILRTWLKAMTFGLRYSFFAHNPKLPTCYFCDVVTGQRGRASLGESDAYAAASGIYGFAAMESIVGGRYFFTLQ